MGVDYSIHLGPYVECDVERVKVTRRRRGCCYFPCPLVGELRGRDVKFCPSCGNSIVDDAPFTVEQDKVCASEVQEGFREALFHRDLTPEPGVVIWMPNRRLPAGVREQNYESRGEGSVPIDAGDIVSEAHAFLRDYAGPVAALEAAYGADKVRVKWGMVRWAS